MIVKILRIAVISLGLSLGILFGRAMVWRLPQFNFDRYPQLYSWFGVHRHEVIGFLPYWLVKSTPLSYDPYITKLTYFGLVLESDGTIQKKVNAQELEPGWNMLGSSTLHERLALAKKNGISLSLLVHLADEDEIDQLMAKPDVHAMNLVNEVEPLMREYEFIDLNIDIESFSTASESARQNFTTFITTVKKELKTRDLGTLTVEISPSALIKPFLIDPYEIGKLADQIVLMAYDYHYSGSFSSGPVAPLSGSGKTREFDVRDGIREAELVIPKEKLILGMPLYGYEWETITPQPGAAIVPGSGRSATLKRVAELLQTCTTCQSGIDDSSLETFIIYPDPKDKSHRTIFIGDTHLMKTKLKEVEWWKGAAVWALGYEDTTGLEPLKEFKNQKLLVQ